MKELRTDFFDLVVEINEELINRTLGALFYRGFLDVRGEYTVPVEEIPPALNEFRKISYKLKLKDGPTVDFLGRDTVKLLVSAEAVFKVLNGIRVEFDVVFSIQTSLVFDPETAKLSIDFSRAEISDVDINDRYDLPRSVLGKFNEILSIAVREDLLDKSVDITPSLFLLKLPEMPPGDENRLPVKFKGMKILNDEVVALCINFLDYGWPIRRCCGLYQRQKSCPCTGRGRDEEGFRLLVGEDNETKVGFRERKVRHPLCGRFPGFYCRYC